MFVNVDVIAYICHSDPMKNIDTEKSRSRDENTIQINAWARLIRVSQDLLAKVEIDLKSAGLPPLAWYDVLLELKRVDSAGIRPFQLQERLLIAQYNLSRLIDKLVKAGHVEKTPCEDDGRGFALKITAQGSALQQKMWPFYRQAIQDHFSVKLSDSDIRSLDNILQKIR